MNEKNKDKAPDSGKEQNTDRATSGGGLGQGRETAAGIPKDQMQENDQQGKSKGGTADTGRGASDQLKDELRGPVSSPTTSEVRPSKAGKAGREGGSGINMKDHDNQQLKGPAAGAEWSRQKGMGPESRNEDLKNKIAPTDEDRIRDNDQ